MTRRAVLLATLALAGCAKEPELAVTDAYVRYAPVRGNPSAAYFTIQGGPQDLSLISVTSEVAIRSEMHETMTGPSTGSGQGMSGMAGMKPILSVQVPAGSTIKFEPGGKHVMLWYINPGLAPPKRIRLDFAFSNGRRLQAMAPLVAAGAAAPEGSD